MPPVQRRFGPLANVKPHAQDTANIQYAAKPLKPVGEQDESRYSLMQVSEEPGFYVPTPPNKKKENEYAHVGSLDGSDAEYSLFPTASKRYGSYIVRAPPTSRRVSTHANVESRHAARREAERKLSGPQGDIKRIATLDPLAEESLDRTLSQQNRLSCIVTPTKAQSRPNPSSLSPASRQRRNLSRFTKELERYCVAASTNGRVPLPPSTPTVSESPTTLDTVTEFMPYHKQFKAAGLAVTSREQMPRILESAHPQVPAKHAGRMRGINVTRVQVDGSTVTPSEQGTITQDPEAPAVPDKQDASSAKSAPKPQTPRPQPQSKPTTRSLLPWFLKKTPSAASNAHGDRKFSKDHIHPSEATPAEPLMSPAGLLDSYFDAPTATEPQEEQPVEVDTSLSSRVSSTATDKPLPKQPSPKRRPVPPRSERRHMDNTANWPTAGVLIHDDTPPPLNQDDSEVSSDDEPPPAKDSDSVHSWTTIEDELPDEPRRTPPVPPKEKADTTSTLGEDKPETPPKEVSLKEPEPQERRRHHPGHSICNKWYKATNKRRRSVSKPLPVPTTIREESETSQDGATKPAPADDAAPRLSVELPFPVEPSSSFERALDAIISKLDAMEERRRYERKMDLEATQRALFKSETPERTKSKTTSLKPSTAPRSEHPASAKAVEAASSSEAALESSDKDINDRDILVGLKMAICAACDEDLDAWICSKTGLRLRRFLADLKAFESVSQERRTAPPTPISRRIRRSGRATRPVQAEQEPRKSTSKKWSQCFGADGQASMDEPTIQDAQPLEAAEE